MKKISSKGRPRKDVITKLKVMAWFNAVAQASGKTAAELEREFADPNHIRRSKKKNKEIRPGLWDKYRRGEVEPRPLPAKGKSLSLIQAVEAKYPGTAKVLHLPLWKLLDFFSQTSIEELDETLRSLRSTQHQFVHDFIPEHTINVDDKNILLQPNPIDIIDQWTIEVINTRKLMLMRQDALIELMLKTIGNAISTKNCPQRD